LVFFIVGEEEEEEGEEEEVYLLWNRWFWSFNWDFLPIKN
jgi:hypothetical protein